MLASVCRGRAMSCKPISGGVKIAVMVFWNLTVSGIRPLLSYALRKRPATKSLASSIEMGLSNGT